MRVVVIGSGIAGLSAALSASARHDVTLLTKASLNEANTRYAQGGIAAALTPEDSPAAHALDTRVAGSELCLADAVRVLCGDGPDRVRELIARNVPFDRDGADFARGLEGAHSIARILHAGGDATGAAIEHTLADAVRASGTTVVEHAVVTDLVVADGVVTGVRWFRSAPPSAGERASGQSGADRRADRTRPHDHALPHISDLSADAVIIATGGAGQLFAHTTNPAVATGDGIAAALRAGAAVADLEFYQFHPTTLAAPGNFLVSEAVRGEGATLRDTSGRRFMLDIDPRAELAPRDVVARGIAAQMAAQDGEPVVLDATHLSAAFLARRFPTIDAACRANGWDWSRQPVPVTPAAHYWMGGIATDTYGRTSLPGLLAVGEAACTGVHGANRLASNSLLEGLVFAHRAVTALDATGPVAADLTAAGFTDDPLVVDLEPTTPAPTWPRTRLQSLMWSAAGVTREASGLEGALRALTGATASTPLAATHEHDPQATPREHDPAATIREHEDANLLLLARALTAAALARTESRGAHYRSDFPEQSDDWRRHSVLTAAIATAPTLREAYAAC